MKDFGLVSVILPVYGVEKYLSQCLETVCGQTYQNLEIIVVDDESPDRCGEVADEFAKNDNRVKVLHIKNRGAAGARNVGLDASTGDYIMFVDSDDWLELNAVEAMMSYMQENDCEIVQCQYTDEYIDKSVCHTYHDREGLCSSAQFIEDMIEKWEYIVIWNKLYKREVMQDIRFVEGRCIDDEFYIYKVIMQAKKIALISDYLYHYRLRKSGAMGNSQKEKQRLRDQVDFITQRFEPLCQAFPMLRQKLLAHMAEVLMSVMRNGAEYKDSYDYAKKQLKKYASETVLSTNISQNIKKSVLTYLWKSRDGFVGKKDRVILEQEGYFD